MKFEARPHNPMKFYDSPLFSCLLLGEQSKIALSFLTYNLRRAINILGVGALVAHFNRRKLENRG